MPVTSYTLPDFINIVAILETFTNVPGGNTRAAPNILCSGLEAGGFSSTPGDNNTSTTPVEALAVYSWDLDHAGVLGVIPSNARITKITIRQQVTNISATSAIDGIFEDPPPTPQIGEANVGSLILLSLVPTTFSDPPPSPALWLTATNAITPAQNGNDPSGTVTTFSCSSALAESRLVDVVFDFASNPNGDFPLGYMDYATFIAEFTAFTAAYNFGTSGTAQFNSATFPNDPACLISGTFSNGGEIDASNLTILVEWEEAAIVTGWDFTPATLTLPDNIIILEHPDDPTGTIEDELIESVFIGDTEIQPDDIWVILWTKFRIVLRIPPDEIEDDIEIEVTFRGTQFSGRVPLGTLSVITADLSGVYQFDVAAHTDTLYERTAAPTTQEVAIPSPFLITHFVDNKETDILHFTGTRMGIRGAGIAHQQLISVDTINTKEFGNLTLRTSNNISPFALANFNDQQGALRVYTDAISEFMNINEIIIFFKKLFTGYPQ